MRSSVRVVAIAALVVLGTMLVAGGAGASVATKTKKVSADSYVKTMCTGYNKVISDLGDFADALTGSSAVGDPAAFQAEVTTLSEEFLAKVATTEKKLKRIYPDVDGGKKIAKQFSKNAVEVQDFVGEAVDELLAADPTSPAFTANITVFGVTLSTMGNQLTDVTSGIDDQDFIKAIGNQKRCHEIFPVTGG